MFSFLVRAVIIHTLAGRNGEIKTEETVSIQAGDRVRDPAARADRRSLLSGFLSTETTTARNIFTDAQRNLICLIVCRIIDERCGFRTEKSTCTFDYTLQIYSILLGGGKADLTLYVPSQVKLLIRLTTICYWVNLTLSELVTLHYRGLARRVEVDMSRSWAKLRLLLASNPVIHTRWVFIPLISFIIH